MPYIQLKRTQWRTSLYTIQEMVSRQNFSKIDDITLQIRAHHQQSIRK